MCRGLVIFNLLTAPPFPAYDHVRSRLRLRYLIDARNGGAVRLRVHWGTDKLTCGHGLALKEPVLSSHLCITKVPIGKTSVRRITEKLKNF